MTYPGESGQSAGRRFIDLIGEERLDHGACVSERGRTSSRVYGAFLCGKEAFILSALYPTHVGLNPYLSGSNQYHAFHSGAGIELADLQDVVRIMS